jgi:hypothetical protein
MNTLHSLSGLIVLANSLFLFAAVLSAEEARLWNAVTANCLDFNAWTALIDETEKTAEVMFLLLPSP